MEKPTTLSDLFIKLDNLKSIFDYGQRIIPVVQSLIDFMRDTVPLLENINSSISESTKKIPKASNQITNVTNATELATNEILDMVDSICRETVGIETLMSNMKNAHLIELDYSVMEKEEIVNYFNNIFLRSEPFIEQITSKLSKVSSDASNILISLQVQDITAQQLAAVNHLIGSVQQKLSALLKNFNEADNDNENEERDFVNEQAFNADARYNKDTDKQDLADSLIHDNITSQAEIDKLFN